MGTGCHPPSWETQLAQLPSKVTRESSFLLLSNTLLNSLWV